MGISVHMDIRDKKILIVGGGKVALRKARLFLREGAIVHMIAPHIRKECIELSCIYSQKNYASKDLIGAFLVVAATDDEMVNLSIVQDAKKEGILCMSCNQDHHVDVQSLCYDETGSVHLAISTKQRYPALNSVILKDVSAYVEKVYATRLKLLAQLRERILSNTQIADKQKLLCFLANAHIRLVEFLLKAIEKRKCCILAFHGVKIKESMSEIEDFLNLLQRQLPAYALGFGYISIGVVDTLNAEKNTVFSIAYLMEVLSCFSIHVFLYPMLFQEGRFYNELCTYQCSVFDVCKPPFLRMEDVRELIGLCVGNKNEEKDIICLYHSSRTGKFASMLSQLKEEYPNVLFLHEALQDCVDLEYYEKDVVLIPLYMLKGLHMQQDLDSDSLLIKKLREQGCNVEYHKVACFLRKGLQNLFIRKIIEQINSFDS